MHKIAVFRTVKKWMVCKSVETEIIRPSTDKEVKYMASKNTNSGNSNNSKSNLQDLKAEVASSLNIDLNPDKNGELTSREAGSIGGEMVKRMIEYAEKNIK